MKKVVLIMVSVLVMIVFIGFNYLLWDRENKEKDIVSLRSSYENSDASISALEREVKQLEEENTGLLQQREGLQNTLDEEREKYSSLSKEKSACDTTVYNKNVLINGLKKSANIEIMHLPVVNWVGSINAKEYETAYKLQFHHKYYPGGITLQQFSYYYSNVIESIKINTVDLITNGMPIQRDGEVVVIAEFEVVLGENLSGIGWATEDLIAFVDGANRYYFTLLYDNYINEWVIGSISGAL